MNEGIRVRVLVAAQYNGPDHKNIPGGWSQVGDEIVVAGVDYAFSLREMGFVVFTDTSDERIALEEELAHIQASLDALDLKHTVVQELTDEQETQDRADQQAGGQLNVEGQETHQAKGVTRRGRGAKRA